VGGTSLIGDEVKTQRVMIMERWEKIKEYAIFVGVYPFPLIFLVRKE
jgi:hypothetical protein